MNRTMDQSMIYDDITNSMDDNDLKSSTKLVFDCETCTNTTDQTTPTDNYNLMPISTMFNQWLRHLLSSALTSSSSSSCSCGICYNCSSSTATTTTNITTATKTLTQSLALNCLFKVNGKLSSSTTSCSSSCTSSLSSSLILQCCHHSDQPYNHYKKYQQRPSLDQDDPDTDYDHQRRWQTNQEKQNSTIDSNHRHHHHYQIYHSHIQFLLNKFRFLLFYIPLILLVTICKSAFFFISLHSNHFFSIRLSFNR